MYEYILIYFISVNLFGVLINFADKVKAQHNKWRIRESTLWFISLIGGAAGTYITMKMIRHKTKHKNFMIGMPILMVIQVAVVILLYFHF